MDIETSKIDNTNLEPEELYLFNTNDPQCPPKSSLWGIFDRCNGKQILLESSSYDLTTFHLWNPLPAEYIYCRLATRKELRYYTNNIAIFESHKWLCG